MGETIVGQSVFAQLRTVDAGLLDELAFLSRLRRAETRGRASYATPGRVWLARRLGVSVRTVSRHVSALVGLGLVERTQRRPVSGKWQTNLYVLVSRGAWLVARTMQRLRRPLAVGHKRLTSSPKKGENGGRPEGRGALCAFIRTLEANIGRSRPEIGGG